MNQKRTNVTSTPIVIPVEHPVARVQLNHGAVYAASTEIEFDSPTGESIDGGPERSGSNEQAMQLASAIDSLSQQLTSIRDQSAITQSDIATLAVDLATTLVEQIFAESLADAKVDFRPLVESLVAKCGISRPLRVRMHPDDLTALQAALNESPSGGRPDWADDQIEWQADPLLARGNCHAESDASGWLFDWQHQLDELRRSLATEIDRMG